METVDDEIAAKAEDFIKRQVTAKKPFFTWINFTHMHFRTHTKPESLGQAGELQSYYHDTMIDHDKNVGQILDLIDELGIADNTIVVYSTDNGPHRNSWPDAGTTKFRSEKNTGWEGAYRVPQIVRWPGKIKPGSISNEIMSHLDWAPTLLAAAGNTDVKEKLLKGYEANGKTYKNHLDGYNFLPYLTGQEEKGPRKEFFYFSDEGDLMGLRYNNWKVHFMVQDQDGHHGDLAAQVPRSAHAVHLQSAHRSVRIRQNHVQHLLGLVHRPCLDSLPDGRCDRPVPEILRGVSARSEAGILHDRRCLQDDTGVPQQ